jgi:hypothetical protein
MEHEEKIAIIKEYKLSEQKIRQIERQLEAIVNKTEDVEVTATGIESVTIPYLLDKIADIGLLNLELLLLNTKNAMAIHLEHNLENELTTEKMEAMMKETMKKLGGLGDKFGLGT